MADMQMEELKTRPEVKIDSQEFQEEVVKTGEKLISECSEVRVRINWFGTASKVDDETKQEMLKGHGAERNAVAISKRLLTSKHDALVALKAARAALMDHVKAWTVPMLAIRTLEGTEATMRKDAGIRLIQKKDMQQFDERLQYLTGVLITSLQAFQRALPVIKQEDKERLGDLYRETDYPDDVTKLVSVEVTYKTTAVDLDWESLCPNIFRRERAAASARMNAIVENAAVEFSKRFVQYVKQVCDQLGNRIRLNPERESPFSEYRDAEVTQRITHAEDPDIPEGHIQIEVRRAGKKGGRQELVWLDPMPIAAYQQLRPYETAERKKLFASSIDNIKQEMEAFINVGDMLGPYKNVVSESVQKVRDILTRASRDQDSERIAEELRKGDYLRNEMQHVLEGAANVVRDAIGEGSRTRRRINAELIGKIDEV